MKGNSQIKVIQIAISKKTRGGITTVLNNWEDSPIWKKYHCKWIETQDNRGIQYKLYYLFSSFFKAIFYFYKFDIVHLHTVPGNSILVQMPVFLIALMYRRKTILHLHVGNQLELHSRDRIFRWVLSKADRIVVLAHTIEKILKDTYSVPESKIKVIYNPAPVVDGIFTKDKYILFMAYLTKNKGYDVVLEAFSKVSKSYPDWELIIAGSGEIDKAKAIVKEKGLDNQVDIRPWVSGREKESLFQHASGYCMASYMEGFPMSVLEAFAYGCPLITTPVGGLPDVLHDGENALVFNFGDIIELQAKIEQLLSSNELRTKLSIASRDLSKNVFGMASIEKELDCLYRSI